MRVRVWRNLRYDCWTVYCCSTRRVLGPEEIVLLKNVTFHVSKRGRKRSIKGRWDSRHAYAEGDLTGITDLFRNTIEGFVKRLPPSWSAYDSKKGAFVNAAGQVVKGPTLLVLFPENESSIYRMGGG